MRSMRWMVDGMVERMVEWDGLRGWWSGVVERMVEWGG